MAEYHKLSELRDELASLGFLVSDNSDKTSFDGRIEYITYDSKDVKKGTFFICKGAGFKAAYLKDAFERGAFAYACETDKLNEIRNDADFPASLESMPYIEVSDMRDALTKISAFYFDRSWDKGIDLIGITGTKGKSTTATMVKSILDEFTGFETAFSSGIYTYDGEHREKSKKLTTPEVIELHKILDGAVKNGCRYLTMECSSQGLKYRRTEDLHYRAAAFLNISEDHISGAEHSDMEDYFTSKLHLLEQTDACCINLDMDPAYLPRVLEKAKACGNEIITFGLSEDADVRTTEVREIPGGLVLDMTVRGELFENVEVNIGGRYNTYNAMAAVAISLILGVDRESIRKGLKNVTVAGRMEHYGIPDRNVDIIVDCAHNKMSYTALFDYARAQYPGRKIGFLFGCVGDKAYNRRKEAGELADKNADFIVITERDPGKEPVEKICDEIYSYVSHKEKAKIITDRDEAVRSILDDAVKYGDSIVLLCGCGSDAYVKRGTKLIPFETDGERVRRFLDERQREK